MAFVGNRWNRVYSYWPHLNQYRGPFIHDKKYNTLGLEKPGKWFQSPDGIWYPTISGGAGNRWQGCEESGSMVGYTTLNNGTITFARLALDSAYVPNVSGDAVAWSFVPTEDVTLDTVYYLVDLYTGTAANVTDLDVELRADSSNAPDVSGASLQTIVSDPTSFSDRWITVSGFTTALTAGTRYWITIGDPDGNVTDNASVTTSFAQAEDGAKVKTSAFYPSIISTNGFNSVASRIASAPAIILSFTDGSVIGNHPWTIRSSTASNTDQKGMFFGGGFGNGNARVVGIQFMSSDNSVNWSSVKIWEGTDGPSGTPFATSVFLFQPGNNNAGYSGGIFSGTHSGDGYPKLTPGTDYRIVMQPSATSDALLNVIMGATDNATLRSAMPGKGNWYQTVESAGAWVDNISAFINFGIIFDDWLPSDPLTTGTGRIFPVLPS